MQAELQTRLERLLEEKELKKSNGSLNANEEGKDFKGDNGTGSDGQNLVGGERLADEQLSDGIIQERLLNAYGQNTQKGSLPKQRLLVVANRLPVRAKRMGEDSWSLEVSVGGLVSALLGIDKIEARWIGWAGVDVPDETGKRSLTNALAEKRCIPVFLDEETVHQYYNGYCNNILWPLFHYLGLPQENHLATTHSFQSQFDAYKRVNQMFADVVNEHYEDGDVVWCHDYHLMFLPQCLKEHNSEMKVGWFLHTPFPSSEIHRILPSRSELLKSVLAADIVGFHTYDYARHFVSACSRILGLEGTPHGVEDQGRITRVAAFPIGIDSNRFIKALELEKVRNKIKELQERFSDRKIILGVDRLDTIKGIPQKILAFEKFLEENPSWHNKVVLIQIAVPTRTDVHEYRKLTSQVHEIVGRINGKFGTLTEVPIHHLDTQLDFHTLCALYAVTDVALVASLRDGMNLVSYEYVACQASKKGVLILSEFAGAAQSLGSGAILVNPWNINEVSTSIYYALNMPDDEREKRHHHNFKHVITHTSQEWAENFLSEFNVTVNQAQMRTKQIPPSLPSSDACERFAQSNNRLLILGFYATLTEPLDAHGRRIDQFAEMQHQLHPDIKDPLKKLCNDPRTTVVVLSGSDRSVLDKNFGEYNMWLAAEHGVFLRSTQGEWMTTMPENLHMDWVNSVKHVFEYFTERTPRSYVELRETSLLWNYKYADVEFGRLQSKDILQHLWTGPISNASVDIVQGGRSVEARAFGVTKGAAIDRILGEIVRHSDVKSPIDCVLCIGHFLSKDEDIYTFFEPHRPESTARMSTASPVNGLACSSGNGSGSDGCCPMRKKQVVRKSSNVLDLKNENYFSCTVGQRKPSSARYLLGSSADVVSLLQELAQSLH
ncbi:Alpha,alpha-trehalose-phosphate synthase (UDP-forming) [Heracleum sosnowskyi]|uniref:alpha,alpha-trehalose-phosphate synthase (UDP-forming) n=1 Tax=Heracleum sosnowskyi TaxID=360622 RepID=A0AAD8HK91_9APIA|nr:Alpha,alpha-trehalose-phosphate synthase (UDP-forming) [Heracleum sosnowskyi]